MSYTTDRVLLTCPCMSAAALESFAIAFKGLARTAGLSFLECGVAIILTGVAGHDLSGVCRMKKTMVKRSEKL